MTLGNSITGIAPEEAKKWKAAVQPVFDEYLEQTKKRSLPGKAALGFLEEQLKLYHAGKFHSQYY